MAKVLIIEDEIDIITNYLKLLKDEGHEVFPGLNGMEGLASLSKNPDIIFCDYRMPRMNGYEFCKAVKTDPKYNSYSNIPIISIGSFPEDKREYLARFHEKPVLEIQFLQAIDDFVK